MKITSKSSHVNMEPGDRMKINVGITHKCDILIMPNGKLWVYHGDDNGLAI